MKKSLKYRIIHNFYKVKNYFESIWFKYVTNPKLIREKAKNDNKSKVEFEGKHNVNLKRVNELMYHSDIDYNLKKDYHNQKLLEARQDYHKYVELNKYYIKPPMFYEPEICDIHNESLEHINPNALKDLIKYENSIKPFKGEVYKFKNIKKP